MTIWMLSQAISLSHAKLKETRSLRIIEDFPQFPLVLHREDDLFRRLHSPTRKPTF